MVLYIFVISICCLASWILFLFIFDSSHGSVPRYFTYLVPLERALVPKFRSMYI